MVEGRNLNTTWRCLHSLIGSSKDSIYCKCSLVRYGSRAMVETLEWIPFLFLEQHKSQTSSFMVFHVFIFQISSVGLVMNCPMIAPQLVISLGRVSCGGVNVHAWMNQCGAGINACACSDIFGTCI